MFPRIGQEVIIEFLEGDPITPSLPGGLQRGSHAAL